MRTSDSPLYIVLKKLHFNKLYRKMQGSLPESVNSIVSEITLKNVYMPLVSEHEIEPVYKQACAYLSKNLTGIRSVTT